MRTREYRVTIDTMDDCFVYHVQANSAAEAHEEGLELALYDGLDATRWYDVTAEVY